ncbi:hypothetical protein [Natrialba chahannaoensis]|uniref:hypothetical protein n=1 Tax=Natrialba chahannaoensis TaxID=68911 RepID=UPI001F4C9276|nr:hypothetical protein [Natrialba chahannaoensis]
MTTAKWLLSALLLLQAHFAASYLVPLDREVQQEFGGLLRWVWPWSDGDSGLLGQLAVSADLPLVGLFLALTAAPFLFVLRWQSSTSGCRLAGGGYWLEAGPSFRWS